MRSLVCGAVTVGLLCGAAGVARAQGAAGPGPVGAIRGVVFDSLAGQPLARAEVWVEGAVATALTDSAGGFVLAGVPAGPRVLTASHAALEAIGLPTLGRAVTVVAGQTTMVVLATPSVRALHARACPVAAAPADSNARRGMLFGEIVDARSGARLAGAAAVVSWIDVERGRRRKLAARSESRTVRSDSLGGYRACGLPIDAELAVRAAAGPFSSGRAFVTIGARQVARLDLAVVSDSAGARGSARLDGVVRDSGGAPRPDARVTVDGTDAEGRTDARGRFALAGLPAGTHTLLVRALGHTPRQLPVALAAGRLTTVEITLGRVVELSPVVVRRRRAADRRAALLADIAGRARSNAFGTLLDSAAIERAGSTRGALAQAPLARVHTRDGVWRVMFTSPQALRNGGQCAADVYLDSQRVPWQVVNDLRPEQILAIEVYRRAADAPVRFVEQGTECGVVLVWTR
jgi:hypothetical protein